MARPTTVFAHGVDASKDEETVRAIVARAKRGESEALSLLYLRYRSYVYGNVRRIVRDDYEAEDITHEVFLKLLTVLERYEERAVPFRRWVARLAHNAAIDYLRTKTPTPAEDLQDTLGTTVVDLPFESRSLQDALATLPDDQRSVVVLRHIVGLSPPEIAGILGKSESSVHGLHHRGRIALKEELQFRDAAPVTLGR